MPVGSLVQGADSGDPESARALFAMLYRDLHAIAERELRRGGGDLTLGATTLLHEAYLSMAARDGVRFDSEAHFLAYAARAMRSLTIDHARRMRARKRGGEFHITGLPDEVPGDAGDRDATTARAESLERLGEALDELARTDPSLANLVDLHFFCGFPLVDIARLRGVSERTVGRDWRRARLVLNRAMTADS